MPKRLKRYYGQGHLHFVTFSCYQRLPLLGTKRARDIFVSELAKLREQLGFRLLGYVVMPNHVHLLLDEPPRGTPSTVLQLPWSSWVFYFENGSGLIPIDRLER